jgi:hypothetical protein
MSLRSQNRATQGTCNSARAGAYVASIVFATFVSCPLCAHARVFRRGPTWRCFVACSKFRKRFVPYAAAAAAPCVLTLPLSACCCSCLRAEASCHSLRNGCHACDGAALASFCAKTNEKTSALLPQPCDRQSTPTRRSNPSKSALKLSKLRSRSQPTHAIMMLRSGLTDRAGGAGSVGSCARCRTGAARAAACAAVGSARSKNVHEAAVNNRWPSVQ